MNTTAGPVVPIPSFEELSPAFQERARRGTPPETAQWQIRPTRTIGVRAMFNSSFECYDQGGRAASHVSKPATGWTLPICSTIAPVVVLSVSAHD